MTFTIHRQSLVDELVLLNSVVAKTNVIPILSTVMMGLVGDELTLTTSDCDVVVESRMVAQGDSWGGCVSCTQLLALARLLDTETLTFKPKGEQVKVSAGQSNHKLPVLATDQFPEIHRVDSEPLTLNLAQLQTAVETVAFATLEPRNETKADDYRFTGLSLKVTDGKCEVAASRKVVTASAEFTAEGTLTTILPRSAVTALLKLQGESVAVSADENHVQFVAGERTLVARPLMGKFPEWRSFLPSLPLEVKVDADAFTNAIRRASVTMGVDNAVGYEPMRLTFSSDSLTVETRGGDRGQSLEPVSVQGNLNGNLLQLGFVSGQVLGVLGKCEGEVVVSAADARSPLLFKSTTAEFVVMPTSLRSWPQ